MLNLSCLQSLKHSFAFISQMFVVVSTIEKGVEKVQAVSTSFFKKLDGNLQYFYPKKGKNVKKAVLQQELPNEKDWYRIDEFEIISNEFGNIIYLYKKHIYCN